MDFSQSDTSSDVPNQALSPRSQFYAAVNSADGTTPPPSRTASSDVLCNTVNMYTECSIPPYPPVRFDAIAQRTHPEEYPAYQEVKTTPRLDNGSLSHVQQPILHAPNGPFCQQTPYTSPYSTAPPEVVKRSTKSKPNAENGDKPPRAAHTKLSDVADPYICSVCYHQCVRKESIRKHLIDRHGWKREAVGMIQTRSELMAAVNEGNKMPDKNNKHDSKLPEPKKRKYQLNPTPTQSHGNESQVVPTLSMPANRLPKAAIVDTATSAPLVDIPNWAECAEVDAYLMALRARDEPFSNTGLTAIARAALLLLSDNDRAKVMSSGGDRFNIPLTKIQGAVQDAVSYKAALEHHPAKPRSPGPKPIMLKLTNAAFIIETGDETHTEGRVRGTRMDKNEGGDA